MKDKLSVGDIAKKTGLTARTLQYYDNIGLLSASCRINGRRYYTNDDLIKLEQIQCYKLLGFSLEEIKEKLLTNPTIPELKDRFIEHIRMMFNKIEQFYTVLASIDASVTALSLGKYPPPGLLADLIQSLNDACFIEWSPQLFSDQDKQQYARISEKPDEAFKFYHDWKAISIEAAMLKELDIKPKSDAAQKLAKRYWEFIMDATNGDAGRYQIFANFMGKRDQWAIGEVKLMDASNDYLAQALDYYIEQNKIEIPDFLQE